MLCMPLNTLHSMTYFLINWNISCAFIIIIIKLGKEYFQLGLADSKLLNFYTNKSLKCVNLCMFIMMLRFVFFLKQTPHKKTFYYLEQLILKHKLHQNALNIKEINGESMEYDFINIHLFTYIYHITSLKGQGMFFSSGPQTNLHWEVGNFIHHQRN